MVTKAKRTSNNRWDRENMTILACKVRREYAEKAKQLAADKNTNINAVFLSALADFVDGDTLQIKYNPDEDGITKEQIEAAAEAAGQSVNAWIIDAIKDKL